MTKLVSFKVTDDQKAEVEALKGRYNISGPLREALSSVLAQIKKEREA